MKHGIFRDMFIQIHTEIRVYWNAPEHLLWNIYYKTIIN